MVLLLRLIFWDLQLEFMLLENYKVLKLHGEIFLKSKQLIHFILTIF